MDSEERESRGNLFSETRSCWPSSPHSHSSCAGKKRKEKKGGKKPSPLLYFIADTVNFLPAVLVTVLRESL